MLRGHTKCHHRRRLRLPDFVRCHLLWQNLGFMVRSIFRASLPKVRSIISDLGRHPPEQAPESSVHVALVTKTRLERDACTGLVGLAQQERCTLKAKPCRSLHQSFAGCTPIRGPEPRRV
jgi:hypothetical protein